MGASEWVRAGAEEGVVSLLPTSESCASLYMRLTLHGMSLNKVDRADSDSGEEERFGARVIGGVVGGCRWRVAGVTVKRRPFSNPPSASMHLRI